jgi:hypothetical protein
MYQRKVYTGVPELPPQRKKEYVFVVQSIGSFTLQKVQKSLYLAGIFYQAYY